MTASQESIRVVSKCHTDEGEYIGRGSPLGNPFSHLRGTRAIRVRTREEAVTMYRDYLHMEIKKGNPRITAELGRLYRILEEEGELTLKCCASRFCHGEVIKEILEECLKKSGDAIA